MKNLRTFSKRFSSVFAFVFGLLVLVNCQPARSEKMTDDKPEKDQSIMLALLLDTAIVWMDLSTRQSHNYGRL